MKDCIAVFDMGTTSVKVCIFTPELNLIAWSIQEYALHTSGGMVEAQGAEYLRAARDGMTDALAQADGWHVSAVSVTTQGETFAPVDKTGTPLRPFLVWLDSRADAQAAELRTKLPEDVFYRTTGLPEISGALPLAKLLWIRECEPEILERTCKFLLLEDYLLWWLTGEFVSEKALATSTGWFSLKEDNYWQEALDAAGIPADKLPRLLDCGELAGRLTDAAAEFLGLEPGIAVITGAMDQTAAALAGGCIRPGAVTETTGAALVLAACTDAPVFAEGHHVTIYRHAFPGKYIYLPIGNTGGMALQWFRDQFCKDLPGGRAGYAALDQMAAEVPCGCEGLVFLPYLSGNVDPDTCPEARACFFGGRLSSTRAHYARSVMEAICFQVRDFLDMLEDLGCPAEEVFSLGGGSRSPLWLQMKADVCGRSFTAPACSEATAMGAAILALWGTGMVPRGQRPDLKPGTTYVPNRDNSAAYRKAYRLYRKLYAAVKPLYFEKEES